MDAVSFVKSLKLPADSEGPLRRATAPATAALALKTTDGERSGYVAAGSLVSFTSALQAQQKDDVLNSTLLAQLAANKVHDRYKETDEWFKFYVNVMENVGWVLQGFQFDNYESHTESFQISAVVLELLAALVGDEEELIALVKDTLIALAKSGDDITLFGSSSSSSERGAFQIVPCTVDKSKQVNVAFIGSYFTASQVANNYLFVTMKKQDIKLFKTAQTFTLNETVYSQVRQAIIEKLGNKAKQFIKNLPDI